MRQFFAILKDSFREAVDGFVIYAMLGLSALAIVIVGSMSFRPVPPEEAFGRIAQRFNAIIPERGQGRTLSGSTGGTEYKVSAVAPEGRGHTFRLTVTAQPTRATAESAPEEKADGKGEAKAEEKPAAEPKAVPGADSFRASVAQWAGKAGEGVDFGAGGKSGKKGGRAVFSMPTEATPEEQRAVTTALMEEFLASQFDAQAGISATVKRVAAGVAEPEYAFDVATAGGSGVRGWPHQVKIFFGAVNISDDAPLGMVLYGIEDKVINGLGAGVALLISIILTAFYVPNMIRKGSVDLLVSKPIGRTPLLAYKYVGGLTFIFLVSAFTVGGMWLVLAVRSGFWDPTFLVLIPVLTFTFAILYSVSVLVGVVTRSPIVAMLATIGAMFFFWLVGVGKQFVEERRNTGGDTSGWLVTVIDGLNAVLPRYKDLDTITSKLIAEGTLTPAEMRIVGLASIDYPSWGVTFGMSFAFIAVMLALACWVFNRRDS
jgi:ABC-type transport system involved in multi-copper enzyme maturation permease subunit